MLWYFRHLYWKWKNKYRIESEGIYGASTVSRTVSFFVSNRDSLLRYTGLGAHETRSGYNNYRKLRTYLDCFYPVLF